MQPNYGETRPADTVRKENGMGTPVENLTREPWMRSVPTPVANEFGETHYDAASKASGAIDAFAAQKKPGGLK